MNQRRSIHLALLAVWISFAAQNADAQIDIDTYRAIDGVASTDRVGNLILLSADDQPKMAYVAVIDCKGAEHVLVKATKDGKRIEAEKLEKNRWLIRGTGTITVDVTTFSPSTGFDNQVKEIVLGQADPEPDDPQPGPQPTPAPVQNLSVLVVYESAQTPQLPRSQLSIFQSADLRNWLNTICSLDTQTGQRNFRFFDQHTTFPANCDSSWCKLMSIPRDSLPWLVIGDGGKAVHSGPLPNSVDEFKALVGRYANAQ
jgi:hypothetical protein